MERVAARLAVAAKPAVLGVAFNSECLREDSANSDQENAACMTATALRRPVPVI
jgi:hypothetical protein